MSGNLQFQTLVGELEKLWENEFRLLREKYSQWKGNEMCDRQVDENNRERRDDENFGGVLTKK